MLKVDKALAHPFLESVRRTQSETVEANPFGMEFENVPLNKEALKGMYGSGCFVCCAAVRIHS